ncbi:MAG: nucleotidyltransferase family protein [Polyangiaceae bacterium]|nr:nucleotidyltransferase family protein [Polyangiaceae bacterium]
MSHRELRTAALAPLRAEPEPDVAISVARARPRELEEYLAAHRLRLLWRDALLRQNVWTELPDRLRANLDRGEVIATARVLAQERLAVDASRALTEGGVEHALMKGAHLRRELYPHPALRPSDDVDVIVPREKRDLALATLGGARLERSSKAPSPHELSLTRDGLGVDLHFHPFRPGRARFDPTPAMLASRVTGGPLPVLNDLWTSIVLTVGAALGDYVTARLLRAVELDLWVRRGRVPWREFASLVKRLGLATAAWTMLAFTQDCLSTPLPDATLSQLRPGVIRCAYLEAWLRLDPARVYAVTPTAARIAFSLALEDTPRDVMRALAARRMVPREG